MKPINAETPSDGASVQPSFSDSLNAIDVTTLDRLVEIRKEHARLAEYRTNAEANKTQVAEAVYRLVSQDYAKRAAAIEEQSAPLKAQARVEYRKLKALLDGLGTREQQAQLQKDELQFRHTVGELNDGELAIKLVDPQRVLDQCASDRKHADAAKARFVEALGSEEQLEASEPSAAPPPPAHAAPRPVERPPVVAAPMPAAAAGAKAAAPPAAGSKVPAPPAAAPAKPPVQDEAGETRMVRPATAVSGALPAPVAPAPTPSSDTGNAPTSPRSPDDPFEGSTMMLATGALVVDDSTGKEYPLGVLNGIGRSDENRICLSNPGISRKHAVISAVAGGFMIKDLGSQNGTFVNGQRVTEKKLAEGDSVEVGSVKFVFRTPWPPRGVNAAQGAEAAQGKG